MQLTVSIVVPEVASECPITFSGVCAGPYNALVDFSMWYQLGNER